MLTTNEILDLEKTLREQFRAAIPRAHAVVDAKFICIASELDNLRQNRAIRTRRPGLENAKRRIMVEVDLI